MARGDPYTFGATQPRLEDAPVPFVATPDRPARGFGTFDTEYPDYSGWGSTYAQQRAEVPMSAVPDTTAAAPVAPANPFAGSSLNTLYGIDSESYLTEDQRKLARQIQGKFDASMDRRDRALAQYAAPRLSSFVEDEALARAMALARGLNIPVQDALGTVQGSGPASRGGTGGGGGGVGGGGRVPTSTAQRVPTTAARTTPPGASASQANKWQQIVGGLSSIIPLLIGKGGMDALTKEGLIGVLKRKYDETFGPGASAYLGDQSFSSIVDNSAGLGVGSTEAGGIFYNPITGMPMYGQQPFETTYPDVYGPGSGWGQDIINPTFPDQPISDIPWWEGGAYGDTPVITDIPWWESGGYGDTPTITDIPWWEG